MAKCQAHPHDLWALSEQSYVPVPIIQNCVKQIPASKKSSIDMAPEMFRDWKRAAWQDGWSISTRNFFNTGPDLMRMWALHNAVTVKKVPPLSCNQA